MHIITQQTPFHTQTYIEKMTINQHDAILNFAIANDAPIVDGSIWTDVRTLERDVLAYHDRSSNGAVEDTASSTNDNTSCHIGV